MGRLVQLLLLLSFFLPATACASENLIEDLHDQQAVVKFLKSGVSKKNKARAKEFFTEGMKYLDKARKDDYWGPVGKSFGASAVYYPRPIALKEYAEASLKSVAKRKSKGELSAKLESLEYFVGICKSAIAADDILHELTKDERAYIEKNISCIEAFIQKREVSDCMPLKLLNIN